MIRNSTVLDLFLIILVNFQAYHNYAYTDSSMAS